MCNTLSGTSMLSSAFPLPCAHCTVCGHLTAYLKASWQCVLHLADKLISLLFDVFALACTLHHLLWTTEFSTQNTCIAATLKLRPAASSSVCQPWLNPGRSLHSTLSHQPSTPTQSDPDEYRYYSVMQNREEEMRNTQAVDQLQAPVFSSFFFFYECNVWPIAVTYREHRCQMTVTATGNSSSL